MTPQRPWELISPEATLTSIIESAGATPGDVVVARVEIATQQVSGVRRVGQPTCSASPSSPDGDDERRARSATLRDVARELAAGDGVAVGDGGAPNGVFITVVCREGRAVATGADAAWAVAWRYSNHFTPTFQGELYVVTPHGWISFGGEDAGFDPRVTSPRRRTTRSREREIKIR